MNYQDAVSIIASGNAPPEALEMAQAVLQAPRRLQFSVRKPTGTILPAGDKDHAFFLSRKFGGAVHCEDTETGKLWRWAGDGNREQWQEVS